MAEDLDQLDLDECKEPLLLRVFEEYPALAPVLAEFADSLIAARISPEEVCAVINIHRKDPRLLALLVGLLAIVSGKQTGIPHRE